MTSPLPGALLIADRGNNRMLLVDPQHRVLWHFPTARDLALGVHLDFNDDTFVEPGGTRDRLERGGGAHDRLGRHQDTPRVHLYGTPGVTAAGRTS